MILTVPNALRLFQYLGDFWVGLSLPSGWFGRRKVDRRFRSFHRKPKAKDFLRKHGSLSGHSRPLRRPTGALMAIMVLRQNKQESRLGHSLVHLLVRSHRSLVGKWIIGWLFFLWMCFYFFCSGPQCRMNRVIRALKCQDISTKIGSMNIYFCFFNLNLLAVFKMVFLFSKNLPVWCLNQFCFVVTDLPLGISFQDHRQRISSSLIWFNLWWQKNENTKKRMEVFFLIFYISCGGNISETEEQ